MDRQIDDIIDKQIVERIVIRLNGIGLLCMSDTKNIHVGRQTDEHIDIDDRIDKQKVGWIVCRLNGNSMICISILGIYLEIDNRQMDIQIDRR